MRKSPKLFLALAIIPQILFIKWISVYPETVETHYSLGFYPIVSKVFRFTLGWLPFSFGDLFYAIAIIYMLRWLILNAKRITQDTKGWFLDVFSAFSVIYFAFHLLWGMNYYRLPLHQKLNLEADYSTEQLMAVTEKLIEKSNALQLQLAKNDSVKVQVPFKEMEVFKMVPEGYHRLREEFPDLDYKPKSIKKSLFSLPLTYMGFSGYLNPLTNEAHVDGYIPIYRFPVVSSHEVAHQLGYAAENEANFIGSLAAINHPNVYFNYCGYTFALKHCLLEVYRRDPEAYEILKEKIHVGILKNYQEVQNFWMEYQNPLEPLFQSSYNHFLKVNNQQDGMKSYSYVVALVVNYFENNAL
ncbi:DUF3810 domain-containing protein [Mangrovimonas sp. CR14]|uniref:DUF3810 domain-containing protein n=1 Tax=Mangrovimonas sp. CR14 TaxID=2706120 RepID=UPI0014231F99|nr:DUF3810 domain-containing protein [Mangrovimonas sp. CR14]NIK92709.1 DUF3810 domain-containing protein [Mangrovimonas sp. CR14]